MKKKPKAQRPQIASKRTPSSRVSTRLTEQASKWIRTKDVFYLPEYVRVTMNRLGSEGFVAYLVGGSVRDFILQRTPKDHDIVTDALPDDLCRIFPDAITVGKQFGVIKIPVPGVSEPLEIATFRKDLEYIDYRRPSGIEFAGPLEDAARRDFTINALYYDPKTQSILDPTGGLNDLKNRVLRTIGDGKERFKEDALRLLRAVRLSSRLGFDLETQTEIALKDRFRLISKVSAERIRDELTLIITSKKPGAALAVLHEYGLLGVVLPEITALKREVIRHIMRVLDHLAKEGENENGVLAWAALLHECGRAGLLSGTAVAHTESLRLMQQSDVLRASGERMRLSRDEIESLIQIVEGARKCIEVYEMRESTLQRFLRSDEIDAILALHRANARAGDGNLAFYEFAKNRLAEIRTQPSQERLVTGEDLIQLGFGPGPQFSAILRWIEDQWLEGRAKSKQEALEMVLKHFVR